MSEEINEAYILDEPIRAQKREEFRESLIESIEEVLSFSQVVLNFLELNTSFKRTTILEYPYVFSRELEDLFGQSAKGIEELIIERLYKKICKKYIKDSNMNFEDYISEALKRYTECY